MELSEKLLNLLRTNGDNVHNFDGPFSVTIVGVAAKDVLRTIYSRRASISNLVSRDFVARITEFKGERILMSRVFYETKEFLVFTDEAANTLIGIIQTV